MDGVCSFLMAIAASVVGNYVSKWLDRHFRGR